MENGLKIVMEYWLSILKKNSWTQNSRLHIQGHFLGIPMVKDIGGQAAIVCVGRGGGRKCS